MTNDQKGALGRADLKTPIQEQDASALFLARIGRIMASLKVSTETELAKLLGIAQQSVAKARKRQRIPSGWIEKISEEYDISADWILWGEEPILRADALSSNEDDYFNKEENEVLDKKRHKGGISVNRLKDAINMVESEILNMNVTIDSNDKAEICALVYDEMEESILNPTKDMVRGCIKLVLRLREYL